MTGRGELMKKIISDYRYNSKQCTSGNSVSVSKKNSQSDLKLILSWQGLVVKVTGKRNRV